MPSETCYKMIMGFESFRSAPYLDTSNVWTIGYGSTRDASGKPVTHETPNITVAQAMALMDRDIDAVGSYVDAELAGVTITQNQMDAICSLVYNIGDGHFLTSNLLKNLRAGKPVIADNFLSWNESGGKVSAGLVARRKAEWALYILATKFINIMALSI